MNYFDLLVYLDEQQIMYTLVGNDKNNIAGVIHKLTVHDAKTFFQLWKISGKQSQIQEVEYHLFFVFGSVQVFGFSFDPEEKRLISELIEDENRSASDMIQE